MASRQFSRLRAFALAGLFVMYACSETPAPPPVEGSWSGVCVDLDGDGFGFQCGPGNDCDDEDSALHVGCSQCAKPGEGCACEEGDAPLACQLPYKLDAAGALVCRSGTRYCRDGSWTGCEGIGSFVVSPSRALTARARIDRDAGAVRCDPCHPDCYTVEDPLGSEPDGAVGPGLVSAPNGGITLAYDGPSGAPDGGMPWQWGDGGPLDEQPCMPAVDVDCDGLPDSHDADPTPGARHRTLIYRLDPNAQQTHVVQSPISVGLADIYLYLDATGSMGDERDRLIADLRAGNFLPNAGAGIDCLDHDLDGAPDNQLKELGITGNLACTTRDVRFGAGFFRDIPFAGPSAVDGQQVGPFDYEMFEHRVDIGAAFEPLDTALRGMTTRSNYNIPEGGMQGLWALATGRQIYAGWNRPGVPERRGCAPFTWGYPCFRDAAFPVVLQITDAPMQSGPGTSPNSATNPPTPANCLSNAFEYAGGISCAPLDYDSRVLSGLSAGTAPSYLPLTQPAESLNDAEIVGAIDDGLITYVGDTRRMAADVSYEQLGLTCASDTAAWSGEQAAGDAVFRFTVQSADTFLISARGSRFDSTLLLMRTDPAGQPEAVVGCADDALATPDDELQRDDAAELQLTLSPGSYAVVLKGYASEDEGMFQLTLGNPVLAQPGSFEPRRFGGPEGVEAALRDAAVRVITIQSGRDRYAEQQARTLSLATSAVDLTGQALSVRMDADANIGDEVVDTVHRLLASSALTVTMRAVQAYQDPDPALPYVFEAVDSPGDGCDPPVDMNGDGILDAHPRCLPGSRPRFNVTFRNPGNASVPPNPSDSTGHGGYRLWAQVLGDGRFVLDEYLVYIATDLPPPPTQPSYLPTGTYSELVEATGCAASEAATWQTQHWDATLPPGTRVRFQICSGATEDEARACAPLQTVELTSASTRCTTHADCGTDYCATGGVCQTATGVECTSDEACGANGLCVTAGSQRSCNFARPAVDLATLPQSIQGKRFANVRIELRASEARTAAPTMHKWRLDYTCAPGS